MGMLLHRHSKKIVPDKTVKQEKTKKNDTKKSGKSSK